MTRRPPPSNQGIRRITDDGWERQFDLDAWARSFYLLGQIYERRGDNAWARAQYARFVDLWRDGDLERGWVADAQTKLAR